MLNSNLLTAERVRTVQALNTVTNPLIVPPLVNPVLNPLMTSSLANPLVASTLLGNSVVNPVNPLLGSYLV